MQVCAATEILFFGVGKFGLFFFPRNCQYIKGYFLLFSTVSKQYVHGFSCFTPISCGIDFCWRALGKALKATFFQFGPPITRRHCGSLHTREGKKSLWNVYKISVLSHASDLRQEMKTCFCYECHQTVKLEVVSRC